MSKIIQWFMDLKIAKKLMIYYFIIFIIFILVGTFTYRQINNGITVNKVSQLSMETVKSISTNLDFVINTANEQSIMLLSSQTLQTALNTNNEDFNFTYQNEVCNYLANSTDFSDIISSIYVLDNYGNEYYVDKSSFKNISLENMKSQKWFDKLLQLKGGYMLQTNGGGAFTDNTESFVSLIRVVNDTNSQKPIGYLVVNISSKYINRFLNNGNLYNTKFILMDENSNLIINSMTDVKNVSDILGNSSDNKSVIKKVNNKNYIISSWQNSLNWKIASITPFNELTKQAQTYSIVLFIAVFINGILLILGLIFASLMISKPIQKLASSMIAVEKGEFKEVHIKTGNDEIGKLKDVYNMMIREIQKLFDNIVKENAIKRKKELEVLQAQIKPHFLYNSFDAISSLALSGNNKDVYDIVKALGKFYKAFLNNGKEEITIKEELEIVKQYLTIQKIRFVDKFTFNETFDEQTYKYTIPRLILQPLVENAINHGIKPLKGHGIITIQSLYDTDRIILTVEDNGAGMDEAKVAEIKKGLSLGVGLRATIERLNIYYNSPDVFDIKSEKGIGTVITITIPLDQEMNYD